MEFWGDLSHTKRISLITELFDVMALLDKANTTSYGNPELTKVNLGALLHLGVKNIHLGPTLPGFYSFAFGTKIKSPLFPGLREAINRN